jgi:hypothetical protein
LPAEAHGSTAAKPLSSAQRQDGLSILPLAGDEIALPVARLEKDVAARVEVPS